jgi:excisionase family DNA binding protein
MADIPIMLKIHEAATKFNLSYHFTRQLVLQKKVKYVKAGKKYLVNEQSLIDYLNEGESI